MAAKIVLLFSHGFSYNSVQNLSAVVLSKKQKEDSAATFLAQGDHHICINDTLKYMFQTIAFLRSMVSHFTKKHR